MDRPEFDLLKKAGYLWNKPHEIVEIFEKKVADFCGSEYAVAIDSASNGIFLSLKYRNSPQKIIIPKYTYPSVPMHIVHAGYDISFIDIKWSGYYHLSPTNIIDAAGRWTKGMYMDGYTMILSFQFKKHIPIGKGGMILTNDRSEANWLRKASYDGRDIDKSLYEDDLTMLGWHYYMTPEDAARGILLMDQKPDVNEDSHNNTSYRDLTTFSIFSNG